MCTLTAIRTNSPGSELLVAMNRDELRSRADAEPPQELRSGDRRALYPVDPTGGGTWFGVNDAGLILALLNYYPAEARRRAEKRPLPKRSRGHVVAELLRHDTIEAAMAGMTSDGFAPYRLVALHRDSGQAVEAYWNGEETMLVDHDIPLFLSSSSYNEKEVVAARYEFYEKSARDELHAIGGAAEAVDILKRIHFGGDPARPGSHRILMERPGARTHSIAILRCGADSAMMTYWRAPHDRDEFTEHRLAVEARASA